MLQKFLADLAHITNRVRRIAPIIWGKTPTWIITGGIHLPLYTANGVQHTFYESEVLIRHLTQRGVVVRLTERLIQEADVIIRSHVEQPAQRVEHDFLSTFIANPVGNDGQRYSVGLSCQRQAVTIVDVRPRRRILIKT